MELENLINYYLDCIDNLTFIEHDGILVVKNEFWKPISDNNWIDRYQRFISICERNGGILDIELNKTFKSSLGLDVKIRLSKDQYNQMVCKHSDTTIKSDKDGYYMTMEDLDNIKDLDNKLAESLFGDIFDKEINIFDKAYDIANEKYPGIFKKGKINDNYMTLLRIKPDKCPLSNKIHDSDNSYLYIKETSTSYQINFGCNRGCTIGRNCKTKKIGTIKK
jgi:hypothetical protein